MAEVTRVKKHGPPPRRTPRTFDVRLTEGEVDLLLALTGLAAGSGDSPAKYARRLHATLSRAAGYGVLDTDAFAHLELGSVVGFTPYRMPETPNPHSATQRVIDESLTQAIMDGILPRGIRTRPAGRRPLPRFDNPHYPSPYYP